MAVSIAPYIDNDHLMADYLIIIPSGFDSAHPYIDDTGGYWTSSDPYLVTVTADTCHLSHIVTSASIGQLEDTSHKADGSAWFGAGNATSNYLKVYDHTSNVEFGLETHYRTGDYVTPVKGGNGEWIATMDAGLQNGQHNEQGSNTARSAASFDISLNFGAGGPHDGQFRLTIDSSAGGHDVYTLKHAGGDPIYGPVDSSAGDVYAFKHGGDPIYGPPAGTPDLIGYTPITGWFLQDDAGNVLGLTMSADGHVLQDSVNLAFLSGALAHGTNSANISAQDVHITLEEMSLTQLVGVASVSETIHLI